MNTPIQSHAPADKVSAQRSLASVGYENEADQFRRGQCPSCGELFNLRDGAAPEICGECADIFEEK